MLLLLRLNYIFFFFFKISHIKKKLKLTCWIIFYNGWISAHHFLFSLLNIWTLQRWLIFIVLIFSSWIMLYTLSIHWHNLINITNLILFAVACWFTDCQCRALHAIFLNNAHFFIQFFNLFQFRTYLLACTLIIHSRATEIVLNIYPLNITAISIVWEVFLRFVSLKFTCVIVCKKIWNRVSRIIFIFHVENLLFFIEHDIFILRNFRLLSLFNFIIILYHSILFVQFSVFVLTIFLPYNLIWILYFFIIAISVICMIFIKVPYICKTWIILLWTLL